MSKMHNISIYKNKTQRNYADTKTQKIQISTPKKEKTAHQSRLHHYITDNLRINFTNKRSNLLTTNGSKVRDFTPKTV